MNERFSNAEEMFKKAFEAGFLNASNSLSHLSREKISFIHFHHGICNIENQFMDKSISALSHAASNLLLTTEIFGDLSGKSYLFLSQEEYDTITSTIPGGNDGADLKEEFIKEVDNILAAAVITKLADQLQKKMYGDVPELIGKVTSKFEDTIYDDFIEQTNKIYINCAHFTFERHPHLKPVFIWVMDGSLVEGVAA